MFHVCRVLHVHTFVFACTSVIPAEYDSKGTVILKIDYLIKQVFLWELVL